MSRTLRARAVASATTVVAVAGLGLAGAAVTTPARSADPAGDCAVAFPVDEIAAGDAVTGLTVSSGTTPDEFTGEVLGVLDGGIGPGIDMVMVRLTSPEIDRVGIWQGMSGSPVYAEDGRLIGAVGYGLAFGASTVAGVTPFEAMDDYLTDPPAEVTVGRAVARTIAREGDVSVARAAGGFQRLPMPLGVAGVGPARLAAAADRAGDRRWLPRSTYAVGQASAADADASDIVAGGNLAASMAYGDVTMAGVGTATSVCGDRVVGFGHPLTWDGRTSLALHPADAIYVQEDLVAGFKIANLGAPVGTVTDDRRAGITGTLGPLPATADVTSTVTYGDRSRTGVSQVSLRTADALASTTFYSVLANHEAVVDGPITGTEDFAWTITGTDANATPFELTYDDLVSSTGNLMWDLGFGAGDFVYMLGRTPGITIDSVETTGVLRDEVDSVRIAKVEVRQGDTWVRANRRVPLVVRGGGSLAVRVTLVTPSTTTSEGTTTVLPARLDVPPGFAGRRPAVLQVVGGRQVGNGRAPATVGKLEAWLESHVRSDELVVALHHGRSTERVVLGPTGGVVRGSAISLVGVR